MTPTTPVIATSRLARIALANDFADAVSPQNNISVAEIEFALNFLFAPVGIMIGLDGLYVHRTVGVGVAPGGAGPAEIVPNPTTDMTNGSAYTPFAQVKAITDLPYDLCGSFEVNGFHTIPNQNAAQLLEALSCVKASADLVNFFASYFKPMAVGDVMNYTSRPGMSLSHFLGVAATAAWFVGGMLADTWVVGGGTPPIANGVPVSPGAVLPPAQPPIAVVTPA